MSRAFVKEADGDDFTEDLPERPFSGQPNFVTARGLRLIDEEMDRLRKELAEAQAANDRAHQARHARDLRYWTARRASSQLIAPPDNNETAAFGCAVTLERDDGRHQTFRIVGEDEADPAEGRISWFSPMAKALSGRAVGDVATVANSEVEIIGIDSGPEQ